ncbi:MAG TPA: triple tyrosine motif-containing protein [Bacteroidales bacterium]
MSLRNVLIFFLIVNCNLGFADLNGIGKPQIKNYSNLEYEAGMQSWMIDVSNKGIVYFANNDGLLEFDGKNWITYPVNSGSGVRSVKVSDEGKIYVGAFNEFGYFLHDINGKLNYVQLQDKVPVDYRDFDEVWRIFILSQGVVFQSYEQLMIYAGDTINVIPAPSKFHFSFSVNGEIFVNDLRDGLFKLYRNHLVKVPGTESLKGELIINILQKKENLIIITAEKGVFEYNGIALTAWKNSANQFLIDNQAFCCIEINATKYAFGTVQNGLLICDTAGVILQQINRQNGLQNNTVLCLNIDQYGNLWLGLDNGIDYIEINSPLSFFSYSEGISAGYAAVLYEGILYLGTNQGVFAKPWIDLQNGSDNKFQLIPQTQGQVWKLQVVDGELLCGHNSGTFSIRGFQAKRISSEPGGWSFLKLNGYDDILIEGTYSGLLAYKRINDNWVFQNKIKGFDESSRFIENGLDKEIWISHGYKGVFKVSLDEKLDSAIMVKFYNSEQGFPNNFGINVFEFRGKPIFTTSEGIYVFNSKTNRIEYSDEINTLFKNRKPTAIYEDGEENIWYFANSKAGVLKKQEDGSYFDLVIPFRQLDDMFIKGFQFVYSINSENVLFGTQNGFAHYLPKYPKNYQFEFNTYIREVTLSGADSIIYFGEKVEKASIPDKIPYDYNGLQFSYSANDFENADELLFSTFLEGYDEDWTRWEKREYREFTNLRHGNYLFKVKARNIYDVESEVCQLEFSILPPWYLSWVAFLFYALVFIIILALFFRIIKYRIGVLKNREKEKQERLYKERERRLLNEALLAEKEVIKLRNDKLRAEMLQKDKELANATMQTLHKNEMLMTLRDELKKLSASSNDEGHKHQSHHLVRKINKEIENENQWKVFETQFVKVHEEFLNSIKSEYPSLSPRELKLCAYLRMNISSKEIATLMNISIRGVEISRYRLRKKLNLTSDINLTDFIISF